VEVPAAETRLLLDFDTATGDSRNVVTFECPRCARNGSDQVDERGVRLLLAAGVQVVVPERGGEVPAGHGPAENR
jgi:hypothetical protein